MERNIGKIFFDKNNTIFLTDERSILYIYDGFAYHPLDVVKNIKKCFQIGDKFCVYHGKIMDIYSDDLRKINSDYSDWVSDEIDDLDYDQDLDIIAILQNNKIGFYINFSNFRNMDYLELPGKYISIKIISNILLATSNHHTDFYFFTENKIKYIGKQDIPSGILSDIIGYDIIRNWFELTNGDKFSITGEIYTQTKKNEFNNNIFKQHNFYLVKDNQFLICYHDTNTYRTIIEPLLQIFPILQIKNIITPIESKTGQITYISIPDGLDIRIESYGLNQILYFGKKIYSMDKYLLEITLTDSNICYDNIDNISKEHTLVIDIATDKPVVDQLLHIIPNIYRLNSEMIFSFEQLDNDKNITSYGEGVTRHIFYRLRKEIDAILLNKFHGLNKNDVFNLGTLLYFGNFEGNEYFQNIDPYFFYSLSNGGDYLALLKKFKGDNYLLYSKQLLEYQNNPEKLLALDLGLSSHKDYMKYLFTRNLNEEQILLYDEFIKGFLYFASRNRSYKLIKEFHINYYIQRLLPPAYFNAELEFSMKNSKTNINKFSEFCLIFKKLFDRLSQEKKSLFLQNVTGSPYYSGQVNIIFGYEEKEITAKQTVYDENINNADPIEVNDVIIQLGPDIENKLEYEISTCEKQIIVYSHPDLDSIGRILDLLTIEDLDVRK